MSPVEWDKLPWWLRLTYLEGFEDAGILGDKQEEHPTSEPKQKADNWTDLTHTNVGGFAAMGLREKVVQVGA